MARPLVNRLSLACGALAAVFICLLALLVVASILSRLAGVYVGGLTEGAGYCMAAAGSLGLAYTFLQGEHIRVDLLLGRLSPRVRCRTEQGAMIVTAGILVFLAWYLGRMVVLSFEYGDLSDGSDALPLWIVQLPVALGFGVFALVAVWTAVDSVVRGRPPLEESAGGLLDRGD